MFSGKTDELIRRLRRATIARQKVQVFKPSIDDRYDTEMLTSHAALALDNALLYRQAHARAQEFEQLKNYNENIVQSIKVGVMVLDTDWRLRSWLFGNRRALH